MPLASSSPPASTPAQARKAEKIAQAGAESFEAIAREWHAKFSPGWVASHGDRILRRLENDIFPWLGKRPIAEIKAPELLAVLRRIESRGAQETAHRAMQNCGQVFRYAVATGRAERDPTGDLRGALPPPKEKHHASIIEPKRIGELLRAIDAYRGFLRDEMRAAAGAAGLRPAGRIAQGAVAGDRPRKGRMAHSCRAHEDAGAAHRTAVAPSHRDPARA